MKGNMLTFAQLCLLLCWMLPVCSKKISFIVNLPEAKQGRDQMSMVENAVDDMYFGCNTTMTKMIKERYFKKENTREFAKVWKNSEVCAKRKLQKRRKEDEALTKDHMQAICVYTAGKDFYTMFNHEVRNNKRTNSFRFHSLHFWLTSAIQILNNNKNCHSSYRRTNIELSGNVNQIIRFGSFASSSYNTNLTNFGYKTCFKIKTCAGAYLKDYPMLGYHEQEVLIPPYEKFKIMKKTKGLYVEGLGDCEVVYILESEGVQSNLNCNAAYESPMVL
ncbi:erythroblast NAD(P)(+)--arginine ADP-ribosyltransferase-like isoform X2 [Anoplopoma fimbria]|uniref:erythroblast NAD(P)(+)--arginine ADP-ribosyltransferase-like isoform X2 n=1 Tax=Anoplopoma fimbria TaxID=229290 RepID=UPI0023EDE64A|nr:erythroblast NAD(P)(+)--arginine ADP-ribosyltransferase-like isoform X2 [Anoplopoma fimbria]